MRRIVIAAAKGIQERLERKMHGVMTENLGALTIKSAVCDYRGRSEDTGPGCKPLWLTQREAEALLVLCAASPISAGPGEQELFVKLGDYFRAHLR